MAIRPSPFGSGGCRLPTPDPDRAADWYERMSETRDLFGLVCARTSLVEPLCGHHRWSELAARIKLTSAAGHLLFRDSHEPG